MIETLKVVTETVITTTHTVTIEEKYRVQAPESMQETFMSDSEDEGGKCLLFPIAKDFIYCFNNKSILCSFAKFDKYQNYIKMKDIAVTLNSKFTFLN